MAENPLRLQLAIQGGGAKIVSLLAAAEYIQGLQRNKKIQLARIAGTSAGVIVGCLLAGDIPIGEVKTYLTTLSQRDREKMFPAYSTNLKKAQLAWKLLHNEPLLSEDELKKILK